MDGTNLRYRLAQALNESCLSNQIKETSIHDLSPSQMAAAVQSGIPVKSDSDKFEFITNVIDALAKKHGFVSKPTSVKPLTNDQEVELKTYTRK
jgi:hypothetical protein